jgi:hypothetical protein
MHIELLKPHTHAGKRIAAGDRLDLPEPRARWLIAQGAAEVTKPAAALAADSKPARRDAAPGPATTGTTQGD